jgi:hypothetical protein
MQVRERVKFCWVGRFLDIISTFTLFYDVSLVLLAAAAQGSSLSPLTKKGSMSLYSRIFTGRLLGSVALRNREGCLLRLCHHSTRQVVLVDRVPVGRHGKPPRFRFDRTPRFLGRLHLQPAPLVPLNTRPESSSAVS